MVGLGDGVLPGFFQLRNFLRIAAKLFFVLALVSGISFFYFLERRFLRREVGGADGVSAFKRHVFEHVGQAGNADHFLRGSGVNVGVEGEHR